MAGWLLAGQDANGFEIPTPAGRMSNFGSWLAGCWLARMLAGLRGQTLPSEKEASDPGWLLAVQHANGVKRPNPAR